MGEERRQGVSSQLHRPLVQVPRDDQRARYPPQDMVTVYVDYFKAGLRFPTCDFLEKVLDH